MTNFRTLFAGLTAGLLLTGAAAAAQAPANDRCSTAQPIAPSATSPGPAIAGTTVGANDDLIGLWGCQNQTTTPVHPDVWYSFTATNTLLSYAITAPSTNPVARFEIFIYQGSCSGALVQLNSGCGAGYVGGGFGGLVAGQQYLIAIASPSAADASDFTLQLANTAPINTPSQDCNNATVLPTNATFSQGRVNSGSGAVAGEVTTNNSCFGAQSGVNTCERQSKWFKFIVGSTGRLQFNINPNDPQDDYDWAVWDVTSDPGGCTTKGNAVACNWTGQKGATGLSLCPGQEPGYQGGDQFDNTTTNQRGASAPITVQAGRVYALLVDNYTTSNLGFTLYLGGACANPPGGQTAAQIGIDAQFNFSVGGCTDMAFFKRTPAPASSPLTYTWFFGDGTTSTQVSPVHTYAGSPDGPTQYPVTLRVSEATLGQTVEYTQIVTVPQTTAARIANSQPTNDICLGDSLTLRARGGATYTWSPTTGISNPTDSVITFAPAVTTKYTLTATRGACETTDTLTIRVTQPLAAAGTIAAPIGGVPHTTAFTPTTATATAWFWDFGDGTTSTDQTPNHTYAKVGQYTVKLQVTYGPANCQTALTEIGKVEVFDPFAYNIITPNGDGKNDTFTANVSILPLSLKVFNRWGRMVYEAKEYQQNWNGGDLPAGTYYYQLQDTAGKSWKGWVEIAR